MKIIVCDPISPKGIALLQSRPEFQVVVLPKPLPEAELIPLVADAVALVVRSETKVKGKVIEAAKQLRVVGRAGVGVDNVDIDAATKHGVVVMNTPGGNTITTAELSFAMLMSLARKVPQGVSSCFEADRILGASPKYSSSERARTGPMPSMRFNAMNASRESMRFDSGFRVSRQELFRVKNATCRCRVRWRE